MRGYKALGNVSGKLGEKYEKVKSDWQLKQVDNCESVRYLVGLCNFDKYDLKNMKI